MSHPVHRLRRRLMLAFSGFALLVATVFGLYALAFMYVVEDSVFNAALQREAQRQLAAHAAQGWVTPLDPSMRVYRDPADLPADMRATFQREPWRSEFPGSDGRHYHVHRLLPAAPASPAWLVAEVSGQLVVRPIRDHVVMVLLVSGAAMVLLAVLLGGWMARRSTRSLYRLVDQVEGLSARHLPPDLSKDFENDEIGVLARALDRLSARITDFVEREHAFTRDASHELRTPLAVISSAAGQLLGEDGLSTRGRQHLQHIRLSALQLQQAVVTLLALAREDDQAQAAVPCRLAPLLERVIVDYAPLLEERPVQVRMEVGEDATLLAEESALQLVLANLVGNAFAHTRDGHVQLCMRGPALVIRNSADASEVLQRWPRPRPFDKGADSQGDGLGLSIVRRLCDQQGLSLDIHAEPGSTVAVLGNHAPGNA